MNDEYLWQKTGDDAEIRRLEEMLAVFRYRETAPPAIAVPVGRSWIRPWRFPFAVTAAGFAGLLLVAGVWLNFPGQSGSDVTFIYHPSTSQDPVPTEIKVPAPPEQSEPPSPAGRTRREIEPTTVSVPRRAATRSRKTRTVVLTRQEREAYEQVLLALSISSSKINIVRDTINGVDQKDNAPEVNNR